jgi:hypothetical protein
MGIGGVGCKGYRWSLAFSGGRIDGYRHFSHLRILYHEIE